MPLVDLDAYKQALQDQRQFAPVNIGSTVAIQGRTYDCWKTLAPVGDTPTAAVVPTITNDAALVKFNASGGLETGIVGARLNSVVPGSYIIADRLAHSGGLSGAAIGAQIANLPTPALTRSTDGIGVMIGITVYTAVGATGSTISASYTDHLGNSGRVTPPLVFGGTGFRELHRMFILPYQEGDLGVLSVESVTTTASTGTVGNFGVTLFKPLYVIAVSDSSSVLSAAGFITGNTFGGVPVVPTDACLFPIAIMAGGNAQASGALLVDEF